MLQTLTRGAGATTTIYIQPGRPFDCEFLSVLFDHGSEMVTDRIKSAFDALLKLPNLRERTSDR